MPSAPPSCPTRGGRPLGAETPDQAAARRAHLARDRERQGLPPTIEDPATLDALAVLLGAGGG